MNALLRPPGSPLGRRLLDPAFLQDPYPTYRALREAGPIHWSDEFFGGAWLLTRHADVDAVLRDDVRFSAQRTGGWVMTGDAARAELKGFQQLFARAMLFVDAPDHQRLRRVMNLGFRPATILALAPQVDALAAGLLDGLDAAAGFDFIERVARVLPARVTARLLGIADADEAEFVAWSDDLAAFIGAPSPTLDDARRAQRGLLAMARYFEAVLPAKRRAPRDDLLSRLAAAEAQGQIGSGPELLAQCAMLLFAGHETTRNLLGNGLQAVLATPGAWQRLHAEPALLPGAVREMLRHDSPVQYTGRRVANDTVLHGQALRRGELVVALIGAANRDPARHADPERFDVARPASGLPLSFGAGPHVCIGAALSTLEAERLFTAMLARWPALRLADAAPQWSGNAVYRGLRRLPLSA